MLQSTRWLRGTVARAAWVGGLLCVSMVLWGTTRAQEPALEFLEQEPMSISVGSEDPLTIGVRNTTTDTLNLEFLLELRTSKGENVTCAPNVQENPVCDITVSPPTGQIEPHTIKLFTLKFAKNPPVAKGYLVVRATNAALAPVYRPIAFVDPILSLSLSIAPNFDAWVLRISLVGLGIIFLVALFWNIWRKFWQKKPFVWPWDYILLEPPSWTKSSWVSNITAVVAVVNVVLGAQSLVVTLRYFSAKQYQGLALVFVALALVGPLCYSAISYSYPLPPPHKDGKTEGEGGYVLLFLVMNGLIFYAAWGQWLLALLLLDELRAEQVWSSATVTIFAGTLLVLALGLLVYTIRAIWVQLTTSAMTRSEYGEWQAIQRIHASFLALEGLEQALRQDLEAKRDTGAKSEDITALITRQQDLQTKMRELEQALEAVRGAGAKSEDITALITRQQELQTGIQAQRNGLQAKNWGYIQLSPQQSSRL